MWQEVAKLLPKVIVHWFEEKLLVSSIQLSFEIRKSDLPRILRDFHKIGRLFIVNIVDDFSLFHIFFIFTWSQSDTTYNFQKYLQKTSDKKNDPKIHALFWIYSFADGLFT